jgi:hypothetical protein
MNAVAVIREGEGPEVLLVHGGARPETTWGALAPLRARWTLARVYRRGYPPSPPPPEGRQDVEVDAADVASVIQGWRAWNVWGNAVLTHGLEADAATLREFLRLAGAPEVDDGPLPDEVARGVRRAHGGRLPGEARSALELIRDAGIPSLVASGGHAPGLERICELSLCDSRLANIQRGERGDEQVSRGGLHPLPERRGGVVGVDRDRSLCDHRAGVVIGVDQMDRRRRVADTGGEDGLVDPISVHSRSAERRQRCGMSVDDPAGERCEGPRADLANVPRERDKVDLMVDERLADRAVHGVRAKLGAVEEYVLDSAGPACWATGAPTLVVISNAISAGS